MNSKPLLASKTFWWNVGTIAVAVGTGTFGFILPAKAALIITGLGNILLRLVTNKPVSMP